MKKTIIDVLTDLSIPANLLGFTYIIDAMEYYSSHKNVRIKICDIYKYVAECENTSWMNAERCIRNAFEVMEYKCDPDIIKMYLPGNNKNNGSRLAMLYLSITRQ